MRILVTLLLLYSVAGVSHNWFDAYKQTHRKLYSIDEENRAYAILEPKYHFARKHGYELTRRSDQNNTNNPFRRRLGNVSRVLPRGNHRLGMPLTMDWRHHGAVTSVKTQGSCGGCFAFSAVGSIEFWHWKHTHVLRDFSVQQWIDCTRQNNFGCDGGLMNFVFEKAKTQPAGPKEFDTYLHREATCKRRHRRPFLKVNQYFVQSDEFHDPIESQLAHNLVKYGPIPIGIDSSNWHFEMYHHGILRESQCGKNIDHAVLLVGFTPEYWIIKNSWGSRWGLGGYIHIERGKNACGINSYASWITDAEV